MRLRSSPTIPIAVYSLSAEPPQASIRILFVGEHGYILCREPYDNGHGHGLQLQQAHRPFDPSLKHGSRLQHATSVQHTRVTI